MTRSAAIRLALAALTGGLAVAAIGFALAGTEPQRPATARRRRLGRAVAEPARADRGRGGADRRSHLRRRRLRLERRFDRGAGDLRHLRRQLADGRAAADRGQPSRRHRPPAGKRLRARRQPPGSGRPSADARRLYSYAPGQQPLAAARRRADGARARSASPGSAIASTRRAATRPTTTPSASSRSTTSEADAGAAGRRCRPVATTSAAPCSTAS